jgi:N-acetylmuramoyl-L-alanine amidase
MRFRKYFLFLLFFCSFSALYGQQSFHEVEAVPGEGAYTLLRRHGLEPAVYFQSFIELNQEQLGAGNSLQLGKTYRLPVVENAGAAVQPDSLIQAEIDTIHSAMAEVAISASISEVAAPEVVKTSKVATPPLKQEETATVLNVPLFGPAYAKVVVKDQQLKGAVYYLVGGHGGPDPGAIGKYGPYSLSEDEYAYDVSLRLARRLMEHGATVYMIIKDADDGIRDENILQHDNDEICHPGIAIPYNQNERLRQRTHAVNMLYLKHKEAYQRMLAIHVDSRNIGQNVDVFFYHHENSPSGKKLADHIHQTISSKYSRYQPNRDYSGNVSTRSSLFVIKYSHPPAVFVELGNIRNDRDQRRFVLPDNRQALANWMAEGILADYKAK